MEWSTKFVSYAHPIPVKHSNIVHVNLILQFRLESKNGIKRQLFGLKERYRNTQGE